MAGRYKDQGADSKRDVVAFESKDELGEENGTDQRSSTNLERDSENAEATDGLGEKGVSTERRTDGGTRGQGSNQSEGERFSSDVVHGRETVASGERSDLKVHTGQGRPVTEVGTARDSFDQRGDSVSFYGTPIESDAASVAQELAASGVSLESAISAQTITC
jgi:hypothetical protein